MKLALVNDVALAVEAMRRVVIGAGHEVVWIAKDGAEAVQKCAQQRPDLILMDLLMPVMDGVECTRRIMAQSPCAILVVTSTVAGAYEKVYEAMALGALDAVDTPTLADPAGAALLLNKIATINKLIHPVPITSQSGPRPGPVSVAAATSPTMPLLAIGASTGGPRAVADVLSTLGPDFPGAIVIVQHVDLHFAPGLATWLHEQSRCPVELVTAGARPRPGVAFLAATANHMIMTAQGALNYTQRPRSYPYRPSVDVFFHSAAFWRGPAAAVLLTGMGKDGAEGLLALRRAGWLTIAQDEASSVVYGMPRAAVELGAAKSILDIKKIGPAVSAHLRHR
jgi:two-component system, chemotaxis family, response regulator WspF